MDARPFDLSRHRLAAGTGLSLGFALGMAGDAEAVDFTVSSTADTGAGSLRQALADSNNNNGPTVDRILFQSGLTGVIGLGSPLPVIDEPIEVLGPGAGGVTVSGNNARRSFAVINTAAGDDVVISGLSLSSGASGASRGGAISSTAADLTLESMDISGNDSGDDGGGVAQSGGSLVIRNSTIADNDATGATSFGGGVWTDVSTNATVQNSTISGNDAERGGGMYLNHAAPISNSTIANNGAHFGGGIYEETGVPWPVLANSVVADNGVTGVGPAGPDMLNTFYASFTLVEQTSGASVMETVAGSNITDDVTNGMNDVDPQLGLLGNNGGPTQTHALPLSSLAVDQGASPDPTDQRGQPRPFDVPGIANSLAVGANGADMGAFELQVPPTPVQPGGGSPTTETPAPKKKKKCKKKKQASAAAKKNCKKKPKKK